MLILQILVLSVRNQFYLCHTYCLSLSIIVPIAVLVGEGRCLSQRRSESRCSPRAEVCRTTALMGEYG